MRAGTRSTRSPSADSGTGRADGSAGPLTGIPIALAILIAMYFFVGSFGATYLVDLLNNRIFAGILTPFLLELFRSV